MSATYRSSGTVAAFRARASGEELHVHDVTVAFRAARPLRNSQEGAVPGIAPHAGLPCVPVDGGEHRRAAPTMSHRRRVFLRDTRECPATRPGIPQELRLESQALDPSGHAWGAACDVGAA